MPVLGSGKTVPLGRMRIHIAFHLHPETLRPPCGDFCGLTGCVLRMRRVKGGEPQAQPLSCANGYLCKCSMRAARKQGVQKCLLSAPSRVAAGNGGTTCAATASSNTRTTNYLTSAPRNGTGARRSSLS